MRPLAGKVVGRIGIWAVVQATIGLIPVVDASARLVPGDGAVLEVSELSPNHCECADAADLCVVLELSPLMFPEGAAAAAGLVFARRPGQSACDLPLPLVLLEAWPRTVLIRAVSPAPEVSEGAEIFGPPPSPAGGPIPRLN